MITPVYDLPAPYSTRLADAQFRIGNFHPSHGPVVVAPGDPEPAVGASLHKGAIVGLGDGVQFDRLESGWIRTVNGSVHNDPVSWAHVATYLPMNVAWTR